ncbi:UPF0102 protein [Fibrobacterales bacterium]|nr:UPF0102 protein [Fibrobacterales bacterium]
MPFAKSHQGLRKLRGRIAETYACAYLERKGCKILARNYRFSGGELDIIAKNAKDEILFIEVKSVWEYGTGSADSRVGALKQKKIWQTATKFLQENGGLEQLSRFDVVAFDFRKEKMKMNYYKNAFISNKVVYHI